MLLRKIPNAQVLRGGDIARQRREFLCKGFNQRGFTRAIHAEQTDAVVRLNAKCHWIEQDFFAITQFDAIGLHQGIRQIVQFGKFKRERRIQMRCCHQFEAIECFDARLRLARFGRLGAKAVNVTLQMGNVALLLCVQGLLLNQAFTTNAFKLGVIAFVTGERLLRHFDDVRAQRVEKIAVVRDDELRRWV